jgi:hypothetical protein
MMKTVDLLRAQFPGRVLIPAVDAGESIGYRPAYTRKMIHFNIFPMPTVKNGDKRMVKLQDLAEFIDKLPATGKPRRGRPPKNKVTNVESSDASPPPTVDSSSSAFVS